MPPDWAFTEPVHWFLKPNSREWWAACLPITGSSCPKWSPLDHWRVGPRHGVFVVSAKPGRLDFGLPVHMHSAKRQLTHQDFAHFRGLRCELAFTDMRDCRAISRSQKSSKQTLCVLCRNVRVSNHKLSLLSRFALQLPICESPKAIAQWQVARKSAVCLKG